MGQVSAICVGIRIGHCPFRFRSRSVESAGNRCGFTKIWVQAGPTSPVRPEPARFPVPSGNRSSQFPALLAESMIAIPKNQVVFDYPPFLCLYKDGSFFRYSGNQIVAASDDPDSETGVSFKDVLITPETGLSARIYLPKITNSDQKLPLVVYFHGGGFCIETPFSPAYHNYCCSLVSKSNVVAVSVHYRRAPEHVVPTAHYDSWTSLQWVASHANGKGGSEPWLNTYADLNRVFFVGDSAGGNITHKMAMQAMEKPLAGMNIVGLGLICPYFYSSVPTKSDLEFPVESHELEKLWFLVANPGSSGNDDPLLNPAPDNLNLAGLPCKSVLVCVAQNDSLRDRGYQYCEILKERGWKGEVETFEAIGEGHDFHLSDPNSEQAVLMMKKMVSFLNQKENR